MKNFIKLTILLAVIGSIVNLSSCKKEDTPPNPTSDITNLEDLIIDPNFDFKTSYDIAIDVTVLDNQGNPLPFIPIDIYQSSTGNYDEPLSSEEKGAILFTGATNSLGALQVDISVPTAISEIVVGTNYLGLIDRVLVPILNNRAEQVIGGGRINTKSIRSTGEFSSINYNTLGTWNSQGVPNYLEPVGDTISQSLLNDINASLPESMPLPQSHPDYFTGPSDFALHITDSCDVWVTFVHEGAGWKNALGFYSYTEGNAPTTANDITNLTLIYPNTSYAGGGGGLYSGDKVHLGIFPPNTVIEWFMVAQGWNVSSSTVGNGVYTHYSQIDFNVETDPSLRQHNVLLYDSVRDLIILGFEDIRRDWGSDNDFNDAVYYATANPITAISTTNLKSIDTTDDTDNDGVSDLFDDYPNDPTKAFDNYSPAEGQFGTLAFEDLWPATGDYDFNDIVIDYQYNLITNINNEVVEMTANYVLRAMGAGFHNSFGIELPVSPSLVASVTGGDYSQSFINLSTNGTEAGQSNAVIIAFEDGYDVLSFPGSGIGINTTDGAPYVTPDTLSQTILFSSSVLLSALGTAPFNPFIIIDQNRDYEVHLPDHAPTDLANQNLFGQYQDDSQPLYGRYYKTENNLPYAINIPVSLAYPYEKDAINQAHLKFNNWAQSSGSVFSDWYLPTPGFRNEAKIYSNQ
ncbi:MAG: LruC domain-containing protein [Bacteroidota bacterium]|nr:LruC domain-containing protein [Bacteroidota bacterium]